MFDDILGPRPTKVRYDGAKKPYEGEMKNAKPQSVGGVKGPIGMAPKQPHDIDPSDEEELELDFDFDDPDEDDCCNGGDDCDCGQGCLEEDAWSTMDKLG